MKTVLSVTVVAAFAAAATGWIMNLIKVVQFVMMDPTSIGGLMIGRIVGIFFAPLGAILGYF